jgi:hypothetical protein
VNIHCTRPNTSVVLNWTSCCSIHNLCCGKMTTTVHKLTICNWPGTTLAYTEHYTRQLHLQCGNLLVNGVATGQKTPTCGKHCGPWRVLGSKLTDDTATDIPLTDCDARREGRQQTTTHQHIHSCHCSQQTASVTPVMRTPGPTSYRSPALQRALVVSVKSGPSSRSNRYCYGMHLRIPGQDSFSFIYLWPV